MTGCEEVEAARGECYWGNLEERFSGNWIRTQGQEKFTYFWCERIYSKGAKRKEASWRAVEAMAERGSWINAIPEESTQGQVHRWRPWPSAGESLSQRLEVKGWMRLFLFLQKGIFLGKRGLITSEKKLLLWLIVLWVGRAQLGGSPLGPPM